MSPEKWQRVKQILEDAWDQDPERHAAFIAEACGGDSEIRSAVESLMVFDQKAKDFLSSPAIGITGQPETAEFGGPPGDTGAGLLDGRYRIVREIGRGGMGVVYLGERADGEYRKQVAIKMADAYPGVDLLRRFRNERQAEAALDHPHIAKFLDGGATPDGVPYMVMEYVDGARIDEWCEDRRLDVRDRIKLFQQVCAAVQYAHDRQVIHRDIKPGNILVGADGNPKLLDFGIAKILDPELAHSPETTLGQAPMTIEYASPEQVRGEPAGPTSDVYSLGVLLYVLLTKQPPYSRQGRSLPEMARAVCEEDPPKPSAAAAPENRKELAGDLDNILLKALAKDPGRRYPSVAAFSNDLDRHLSDLPVSARPDSLTYRLGKFMKRNRAAILSAALAALIISAGAGVLYRWSTIRLLDADRSLAVLPLENLSGEREQEYFADGVTDALIGELSRIEGLRVISRTSVMQYKGLRRPAAAIARDLRAGKLVEGAVFRSGTRLRIAARLIDASSDRPVWNGNYEGELVDVVSVQRQVASAIAHEIGTNLAGGGTGYRRVNLDAYDAYLKGRQLYFNAFTRESVEEAAALFRRSLELDPTYAPAYGGIASCYFLTSNIYVPPVDAMPKAKAAALKAVELDENFAEAHGMLGLVLSLFEFNRGEAEKQFRRSIQLKPSDAETRLWYAQHLAGLGRSDEALAELQRAQTLDPGSTAINAYAGLILYLGRRYDDLIQRLRPLADAHPEYHHPHAFLALAYEQKGDYGQAIAEMERAYALDRQPEALAQLGHIYASAGQPAKARRVLAELKQLARRRYVSPYNFAVLHAGLGERSEALRHMEMVEQDRSEWFAAVNVDPRLDALHPDPRFRAVVRIVGSE